MYIYLGYSHGQNMPARQEDHDHVTGAKQLGTSHPPVFNCT